MLEENLDARSYNLYYADLWVLLGGQAAIDG